MADDAARHESSLDSSFDSKEDYELYMRLMRERQRLQQQPQDKKPVVKRSKPRRVEPAKLQELERGFELQFSGANEERVEARRRSRNKGQQVPPPRPIGEPARAKEWALETVEIRGCDGQSFRTSPNGSAQNLVGPSKAETSNPCDVEDDDSGGSRASSCAGSRPGSSRAMGGSRPGSAASSVGGFDGDTRGVLRFMNDGDNSQLSLLRDTLTKQIDRRGATPPASVGCLQPRRGRVRLSQPRSRPGSSDGYGGGCAGGSCGSSSAGFIGGGGYNGCVGPSQASSSSAIANAIHAENDRIRNQAIRSNSPNDNSAAGKSLSQPRPPVVPASKMGWLSASAEVTGRVPTSPTSPPKASSEEIADRVGRLDRAKQKALLRMLDDLELGEGCDNSWRIRVLSNWGTSRRCGLSQLEALNCDGEVLQIPPASIALRGVHSGSAALARLIDGNPLKASDRHMWVATARSPSVGDIGFDPFEILLGWPPKAASRPVALRLWNLNAPDALDDGARALEVWRGSERIWSGELPRGTGGPDVQSVVVPLKQVLDMAIEQSRQHVVADQEIPNLASMEQAAMQKGSARHPKRSGAEERVSWLDNRSSPSRQHGPPVDEVARTNVMDDEELCRSLRALETFRASASRRFFDRNCSSSADVYPGFSRTQEPQRSQSVQGYRAFNSMNSISSEQMSENTSPRTGDVNGFAPALTAAFGASSSEFHPEALVEELCIGGLTIPVMSFDDNDYLDAPLVDEQQAATGMGMSLIGGLESMRAVVIPTLPRGRTLVFNCVTTWGDPDFLGLAGIEIFDGQGCPIFMKDVLRQVSADPPSINVLGEYEHDPRTVDKLFDQVNLTRDDFHVWLAPFFPGRAHTVTVDLEQIIDISMIRVWNYNKSRLQSSRGVKDLEILLDGHPIFAGQIRQAPGTLSDPEQNCEHILFTQDEALLQAIEERDWLPEYMGDEFQDEERIEPPQEEPGQELANGAAISGMPSERVTSKLRPPTADVHASQRTASASPGPESRGGSRGVRESSRRRTDSVGADGRPLTRANTDRHRSRTFPCCNLTLVLHSTWGDPYYVGLTALEVLDGSLVPLALDASKLDASPRDINALEGVVGDPRTIDKLLDGVSCTVDDRHMWLAPFLKVPLGASLTEPHNVLRVNFGDELQEIAGLHLWNYNKCAEDTCRGVKEFSVYCDDRYIATYLCRKAPGHVHFDFKQLVLLDQPPERQCVSVCGGLSPTPSLAVPPLPPRTTEDQASWSATRERSSSTKLAREGNGYSIGDKPSTPLNRCVAPIEPFPSAGRPVSNPGGGVVGLVPVRVQQQYETSLHPAGFVFKFVLLSTWSDLYYVGLDGVELLDIEGRPLRPRRAHSTQGSVRDLPGMEKDVRTVQNLLRGSPGDSGRMWLAPFSRMPPTIVELVFDEPARISCIRVWNYTRTPSRGARDVEIYVDDILVYQGMLRQGNPGGANAPFPKQSPAAAAAFAAGGWSTSEPVPPRCHEAILFTSLPEIVDRERAMVYLPSPDQVVAFIDQSGPVDIRDRPGLPTGLPERPATALLR